MLKFKDFFNQVKLSSSITALYSNIVIDQIGSGLVGLFLPIFLLEKFGHINYVLLYYLLLHVFYIMLMYLGVKIMSIVGQKTAMILSIPFKVLFYACLYYLSLDYSVLIFTVLLLTVIEIRIILFWIPYHTDFAQFTNKRSRGRVIAMLSSFSSVISIFIPIVSGWIIVNYGFDVLFLAAMMLSAISILPLFFVSETYEKYSWGFIETFKNLFKKENRRMFLSKFADGVENMAGAVIWPIFIFQLLEGNFFQMGVISSLIVLVSVVVRLIIGNYTDKFDKRKIMKLGSALYALGWFFKIFIATSFQIFVVSTYHSFASIIMRTPFDAMIYEKAADSGHYVDEMTMIRELSLTLGKILGVLIIFVFVSIFGLQWTFVLAALASLFVNLL